MYQIFRKKDLSFLKKDSKISKLNKTLGLFDLLFIGLGAVIGTGIFVLIGVNAALVSGPAISISFAISGITCIFVALAYTEVAASLPSSGGSYTYAYVALGELAAWIVGLSVALQFVFCSATVASGWSGYIAGLLSQCDITLPHAFINTPFEGGIIDLPAFLLCLILTFVVCRGTHESSVLNIILVIIKLSAIFLFIILGSGYFDIKNWGSNLSEFMPFGFKGVTLAAGALFLSYTGFDVVANAAEESKNPSKDITIALVGSIVVSMVLYVAIALVLTGMSHYTDLNNKEPLAYALKINGSVFGGMAIAIGVLVGMVAVILVQIYGLSRVLMAMSRDRMLPEFLSRIHNKYRTPYLSTMVVGFIISFVSGFVPMKLMGDLSSLGTLVVLVFITISAIRLRKIMPDLKRPFKCPALWFIVPIALLLCSYLVISLLSSVGAIFACYIFIGIVIYFSYSRLRLSSK